MVIIMKKSVCFTNIVILLLLLIVGTSVLSTSYLGIFNDKYINDGFNYVYLVLIDIVMFIVLVVLNITESIKRIISYIIVLVISLILSISLIGVFKDIPMYFIRYLYALLTLISFIYLISNLNKNINKIF